MKTALLILTIFLCQMSISQESTKMINVEFVGEYVVGRAPCEFLPNGTRRWAKTTGFNIIKSIKGDSKTTYIEMGSSLTKNDDKPLEISQKYVVTLKLTEDRFSELGLNKTSTIMTYKNPIKENEIIKITPNE